MVGEPFGRHGYAAPNGRVGTRAALGDRQPELRLLVRDAALDDRPDERLLGLVIVDDAGLADARLEGDGIEVIPSDDVPPPKTTEGSWR